MRRRGIEGACPAAPVAQGDVAAAAVAVATGRTQKLAYIGVSRDSSKARRSPGGEDLADDAAVVRIGDEVVNVAAEGEETNGTDARSRSWSDAGEAKGAAAASADAESGGEGEGEDEEELAMTAAISAHDVDPTALRWVRESEAGGASNTRAVAVRCESIRSRLLGSAELPTPAGDDIDVAVDVDRDVARAARQYPARSRSTLSMTSTREVRSPIERGPAPSPILREATVGGTIAPPATGTAEETLDVATSP